VASAPLLPATEYTAVLTTGVTSRAGVALAAPYSWTFVTAANASPVASAGQDQDVGFGQRVALDGTASADPEGHALAFAWTQTGGPAVDLEGASTATPAFDAPDEVATLRFQVQVTDVHGATGTDTVAVRNWVDPAKAVLVAAGGSDDDTGGLGHPMRTLAAAIPVAASHGQGGAVYAAGGTYPQAAALDVAASIGVYGGFDDATWYRDPLAHPTVVTGFPTGFVVEAGGARLDGLTIQPTDAGTPGGSSIGVLLRNAPQAVLSGCSIRAGLGGAGNAGAAGWTGPDGHDGDAGMPGSCYTPELVVWGGMGGFGPYDDQWVQGGDGGDGEYEMHCCLGGDHMYSTDGLRGSDTFDGNAGGAGGARGVHSGDSGGDGQVGPDGHPGAPGTGAGPFGSVSEAGYAPAEAGTSGEPGTDGFGGGGGGGSGGDWLVYHLNWTAGNGGGGGGGGSGGGGGGGPGASGGGSFGVMIFASSEVTIRDTDIQAQDGGAGGPGGDGGSGGMEGWGGGGAWVCMDTNGAGGNGGDGGAGGPGGQGGGGGGGPSIAVLEAGGSSSTSLTGVSTSIGAAGAGGAPNGAAGVAAPVVTR